MQHRPWNVLVFDWNFSYQPFSTVLGYSELQMADHNQYEKVFSNSNRLILKYFSMTSFKRNATVLRFSSSVSDAKGEVLGEQTLIYR